MGGRERRRQVQGFPRGRLDGGHVESGDPDTGREIFTGTVGK
jgi:hypothetical protein